MIGKVLRKLVPFALLLALVTGVHRLLPGWPLGVRASSATAETVAVDATRVLQGPFVLSVTASGKLKARTTVTVRTERMEEAKMMWSAQNGIPIKKGDVVARLDDADLQRLVRDTGLEYANAKAEIEKTGRDRALEQRNSQAA